MNATLNSQDLRDVWSATTMSTALPIPLPASVLLALSLSFLYLLYAYLLHPLLLSPLRHIPAAHPLARLTSLWILRRRHAGRENATIRSAHERLGPVVVLGPGEVSVACVRGGIAAVYGGGMEKGGWYDVFGNLG